MASDVKYKTVGSPAVDWKVPIQAVVAIVAWVLAHYAGVELDAQMEVAIAAILGALAGALGPAPETVPKNTPGA